MNILVLTTLYPNNVQHRHGIFIENRVKELVNRYPDAKVKVVAPVPYFPSWLPVTSYQQYSQVVKKEMRSGIEILHPRYWVIPKIGMNITPYFLYQTSLTAIKDIQQAGFAVDVIDSHYFYPDGVVASWIGKKLNIPVMVTARGSDINVIPHNNTARKRIVKAMNNVQVNAAVSKALVNEMVKLAPSANVPVVLRNGVDLKVFTPEAVKPILPCDIEEDEKLIISVGNLVELKGHHLVIEALTLVAKIKLIIIGDGPMRPELERQVIDLNLQERVFFTGNIQQYELPGYYAAADALVLASSREGMPNVLLESLACGTPVVATDVGGCREVVDQCVGRILYKRSFEEIAQALVTIFENNFLPEEVRKYASSFGWQETAAKQFELLNFIAHPNKGLNG